MATIEFRGVMLFVVEKNLITEVVFPETGESPPGQHGASKKHHDGSTAHRHYPGVLVRRNDGREERETLQDTRVHFRGASVDLCSDEIKALPDLAALHPGIGLAFDKSAAKSGSVSMKFFAGATIRTEPPRQPFNVDGKACMLWVSLHVPGPLTMELRSGQPKDDIVLADHDCAIIYHYDDPAPTERKLRDEREIPQDKSSYPDDDFKWLLALCTPRPGSAAWGETELKTPVWRRGVGPKSVVSVSTCFPASIGT